jgi:hypothetical protein
MSVYRPTYENRQDEEVARLVVRVCLRWRARFKKAPFGLSYRDRIVEFSPETPNCHQRNKT